MFILFRNLNKYVPFEYRQERTGVFLLVRQVNLGHPSRIENNGYCSTVLLCMIHLHYKKDGT